MTAHSTHLVLVPGLACTEDLFAEQIASLRGEVAISIADHTRHDMMSAIARAVLAMAPNRFALCGLSMGGYIAFEMVRQAPDRIERLALLDTSALSDTPEQTERRLKLIAMAQTGEFKSRGNATRRRARTSPSERRMNINENCNHIRLRLGRGARCGATASRRAGDDYGHRHDHAVMLLFPLRACTWRRAGRCRRVRAVHEQSRHAGWLP